MPDILGFLNIFFLGFLVLPFVVGPVLVYFKQEMPARPEFYPLTDADIEAATAPEFVRRSNAMQALGFEQAANLQWITSGTRTFTRLFYRQETQELASVTEITAYIKGQITPPVRVHYMEFTTEYIDEVEINTSNSTSLSVLRKSPQKQIHYMPALSDAALLYRVHRHITAGVRGEVKPLPPLNLIEQQIQIDCIKTYKRQAEAGYMYLDEQRSTYRPTAKGAIIMTWKLTWPIGAVRKWHTRRNARRLLAAVGV